MGTISSGCDIVFTIGDNIVRMGSDLSYEQSSLDNIVKVLFQDEKSRFDLYEALKYETQIKEVDSEAIKNNGIVSNNTVYNLAKQYSGLDWEGIDQSTKLFTANWIKYYDQDLSGSIVNQYSKNNNKEKIIIVNPNNPDEVNRLNEYLKVKKLIRTQTTETQAIIDNSDIKYILDIIKNVDQYFNISELKSIIGNEKTTANKKAIANQKLSIYNSIKNGNIRSARDLLEFYIEHNSAFIQLQYRKGNHFYSINPELDRVIALLQGKDITTSQYSDIFANEVSSNSDWDFKYNCAKISKDKFLMILSTKLKDLELNKTPENEQLRKKIQDYIDGKRSNKNIETIINLLIDQTDDEFSYSLNFIDDKYIYLNNVPRTLGNRFKDFTYKTIDLLKPVEFYKGYTIYQDSNGKYYYSRHPITTSTYGTRYNTSIECKKKIDNRVKYNSISKESFIEFKTMEEDVVFIPNQLQKGQIIKSIDIHFNKNLKLNSIEQDLIYNNIHKDNNTLDKFYNYVVGIVQSNDPNKIKDILIKKIDTSEKAACFIYALNEQEGNDRSPITTKVFDSILQRIDKASKNPIYYIVEEVSKPINPKLLGLKVYKEITAKRPTTKLVHKTLLTRINPVEIKNEKVKYDEVGRPLSSTRLLKDLAKKMQDKLGIVIHVESQSDLEQLFKEWSLEMPPNTKGFVHNGEIYINMSNATQSDLFHEYTHIMLGILKSKNFDNYYKLVEILANTKYGSRVKKDLKDSYPYLADSDLNEEVFAELLGKYLAGKGMDAFLNNQLSIQKQVIDEKLGSIFSLNPISEEFYNSTWDNIFKQFSYDLGMLMNEDNGLHINNDNTYGQATNWIEQQIKQYKDSEIGIQEICD